MKILYFVKRNLHIPHLEPVSRIISETRPDIEQVYSSPPYIPSTESNAGIGLTVNRIKALENSGIRLISLDQVYTWKPDVTVMADADFSGITWGGAIVNVNHGLISKGTFYTNNETVQRENGADLICVPGPYHEEVLSKVLRKPVIATGFVKFDPVGKGELTKESARQSLGIPSDKPVVLFAPTFNPELSAVPVVLDNIRELVKHDIILLIKLHGMSPSPWKEMYRLLDLVEPNIRYIESDDITKSIMASDVVISDVSSAYMEAAALNRPVVLVNNPLQQSFHHYNSSDIEYRWRHLGHEVDSLEQLIQSVLNCLENPGEKESLRKKYGALLVGPIDGHAADRIAKAVINVTENVAFRRSTMSIS